MKKFIDFTGKRFGRLVVLTTEKNEDNGKYYCICQCDCGNTCKVLKICLSIGITKSCGCLQKETAKQIGLKNRHYEEKCSYCGKKEHYSLGLCRVCYNRYLRTGTIERKIKRNNKKHIKISDEQMQIAGKIIDENIDIIKASKKVHSNVIKRWNEQRIIKPNTLNKIFEILGLDIYKELKIKKKYKDKDKYTF